MNQGTRQYEFKEGEERKKNIGVYNQDRDRYMRELKRQKKKKEEKIRQEHKRKKEEYESKLLHLEEDSIDAYKVLELPKTTTFNQAKTTLSKEKARIYHPDKFNGNDTQFKIIVKAFTKIVEEFKRKEADKQFNTLKEESRRDLETQKNNSKKNRINMDGRNFNQKLFNKVFDDNRMYSPNDEGYGKWAQENEFETDKIEKTNNNFTLNSFNDNFQNYKRKKKNKQQIVKYKQPEALSSCKLPHQELGQGNVEDFSDKNYTDYKKAHTETTLIDIDSVNHKEYNSVMI